TKEGAALVAGAGQVVAEVRPGVAAPGLLEGRAGAVDALERVKRQRLGPVGCHGGGSGDFLLPARKVNRWIKSGFPFPPARGGGGPAPAESSGPPPRPAA